MFSITSAELSRVKFLRLARAACGPSQGSGLLTDCALRLKIAPNYSLSWERFPPSCRLGKEGGAPNSRGPQGSFRDRPQAPPPVQSDMSLMACGKPLLAIWSDVAF
ncbi:hypothetical protein AAFF_G00019320 [Aldrovandia affinis]|uniref:Uncharacterized protein n=1 Tax=Aldrovandia affinis TaxID=143900 RepID=A0AAD7S5I2_9TELE|nr:hypothetical protein AAFF_G00019320 [Aldrovandia affinis]